MFVDIVNNIVSLCHYVFVALFLLYLYMYFFVCQ